jgi:hypothetical protein
MLDKNECFVDLCRAGMFSMFVLYLEQGGSRSKRFCGSVFSCEFYEGTSKTLLHVAIYCEHVKQGRKN